MKYLKTYENQKKYKIGDYIVSHFSNFGNELKDKAWENYLNNSIGQIIRKIRDENAYIAIYNITDEIYKFSFRNDEKKIC